MYLTLEDLFELKARRTRRTIGREVSHLLNNSLVIRPASAWHADNEQKTSVDVSVPHTGYTTAKLPTIEL